MIPTFVIFLREGIEASIIVAILLAYLDRIGQRHHFRDVFLGVAAALVLVIGGGVAAYLVIKQYEGSTVQTVFETITFLVAASVLTYMTFWMQSHSRTMSADLQRRSEKALNVKARFGLGLLAFQAVGRDAVENMQQLGWLPFLEHPVWNTSSFMSESSSLGDVFHNLLGYADQPTVLQFVVWITFVSVSSTLFITMGRRARRGSPKAVAGEPGTAPSASPSAVIATDVVGPAPTAAPAATTACQASGWSGGPAVR